MNRSALLPLAPLLAALAAAPAGAAEPLGEVAPEFESTPAVGGIIPSRSYKLRKLLTPEVVVLVNEEPITRQMFGLYFQERARTIPGAEEDPRAKLAVLNELINMVIISQDAAAQRLDQRDAVSAQLALLRAKLLTELMVQQQARGNEPDEQTLRTLYAERYAGPTTEYRARHILVADEATARELLARLDAGADFAELARNHSTDTNAADGGDLGWFGAERMVKPFADAVTALTPGSHSREPAETRFGWHLIQLDETRELPPPPFDGVKGELVSALQQQALAGYIGMLRERAQIVFNEASVKPQAPTAEPESAPAQ